jgi:DNA-binding CsgD family transcriptional regulator
MNSNNFAEDFMYASKKYCAHMNKHRENFNKFFRNNITSFTYTRSLNNGNFLAICDNPAIQELFLEMGGFEDDPLFTKCEKVNFGSAFIYPNYNINNHKHNCCRIALEEKFNLSYAFVIIEKHPDYCQTINLEFSNPQRETSIIEKQNIVLQDCLDNANLISACFDQFKKEMFPIIEKEDLFRVNLEKIKQDNYETQEHIVSPHKETIRECLMKIGIIEERDLMLQNIKFTTQERRVIDYYLQGMSAKEIAKEIKRSSRTVEDHISIIKTKLGVKKKAISLP